jgi:hypothetical protein
VERRCGQGAAKTRGFDGRRRWWTHAANNVARGEEQVSGRGRGSVEEGRRQVVCREEGGRDSGGSGVGAAACAEGGLGGGPVHSGGGRGGREGVGRRGLSTVFTGGCVRSQREGKKERGPPGVRTAGLTGKGWTCILRRPLCAPVMGAGAGVILGVVFRGVGVVVAGGEPLR